MQTREENMMIVALNLARQGVGSVEPNPAVGCVIEKGGQIIGQGYHKTYGEAHAEINALADCQSLGVDPKGATAYVTLEPCCHHGKTGPCTEALIKAGVSTVVMACVDPFASVSGQGRRQLEQAGVRVITGICEHEARLLNAPFFHFAHTGQTWVVLKWAQTIDAQLAYGPGQSDSPWISCETSRQEVHKLRRRTQAILVGINTVIADDPLLTPRPDKGHNPWRIVLDNQLRIPDTCRLVKTASEHPLWVVTQKEAYDQQTHKVDSLRGQGVNFLPLDNEPCNLKTLLKHLSGQGIQQLLVEGGPSVLTSFMREALAHEIFVYISGKILGNHGQNPLSFHSKNLTKPLLLHHSTVKGSGTDARLHGFVNSVQKLCEK
ncbi:MAG: bifunctional diaminohydroxyphosphoribosylaminopyrimidine deaminase/5-amino-6-(5-phosphoribosylamino)uracil reductase RibD [Phycisphaeraceae bacterium]|nr:bifunctional diaminohydroxyphosphoribosylaminopyrimidine deaminase/5-amino-6-(5-phosphoribosylamino)uracil reductase RibD [Phycisphaeraceae bacterium]